MITLLQIIKLLNPEQQLALKEFLLEPDEGFGPAELADTLEIFLFAHFSLHIELDNRQRESIVRILENGSAKSAFNIMELV